MIQKSLLNLQSIATPLVAPRLRKSHKTGRIVVYDNSVNRLVAKRLFEKNGNTVMVANNGRQALAILDEAANIGFDCVLMDARYSKSLGQIVAGL